MSLIQQQRLLSTPDGMNRMKRTPTTALQVTMSDAGTTCAVLVLVVVVIVMVCGAP